MKSIATLFIWVTLFCLPFQISAQKSRPSNKHLVKQFSFYKNPNPALNHLNYFENMAVAMQLSPGSEMRLQEESADAYGYTHFKFQQFHSGLPVFGNRYILHEKDGKVITATGHFSPQIKASAKPGINAATAQALARKAMNARTYETSQTAPVLCFMDPAFPKVSETICLAYQVDLHSTEPFDKRRYFVAAATGEIIKHFPLILQEGVPSKAKTRYYGVQDIITDSIAPQQFILRDPTRGGGIFVYNDDGSNFTSTSSTWDLTNAQKDEVALDAHYCTQEYYDMMLSDYSWQGQDGNGQALIVNVHAGDFANAFWDGTASHYGDGDCNYGPLTTLEVVGHEFTHGMIDFTSKLVYDGESGAINESLADMFGKMLERKSDPAHFSWDLGHSFLLDPGAESFRVMDDPNSLGMPAFYKGLYWEDGNGVHTNSSIGNLWFSMLVEGKQGVNEAGAAYTVPAIGMEKAGQLVFEVNKHYFTESSGYNSFYQYSVEVAGILFGQGSTEEVAVKEAWKAVGLPNVPNTALDLRISADNFSDNLFCSIGAFVPLKFNITNTSGQDYDPAMMATVTLSDFQQPDYTVQLDMPIAAGSTVEIVVEDWLTAAQPGFTSVSANLNFVDANPDNNYTSSYFTIAEHESNDVYLYADLSGKKCFETSRVVSLYVVNGSCAPIPAGTVLKFIAQDDSGNLLWQSAPVTLAQELPGSGTLYYEYVLSLENLALFTVVYANDPDPFNNDYYLFEDEDFLPITDNYLNNFEVNGGQDNYLELDFSNADPTLVYQNSRFIASTGQDEDPEAFQRCADPFGVFDSEFAQGINASIHTCIDFSSSPAPVLEFDLAQFRNHFTDTSNYQYSSMFQAAWTGNESGHQVIFDQTEGLVTHHNIPLPAFFKGTLELKFYTELGLWQVYPSQLSMDDFVLLDNLKLSTSVSDTDNPAMLSEIRISPNPTRGITTIQASKGIKTILVQNLNGQTLKTIQVNDNHYDLDVSQLSNGFYLLNIQMEPGTSGIRKLVKMD